MPSLLPRLAAMTAVVTMLAASHATAQKQPAAKATETARLAGVGVQLFLEDSGRLSPDVTEIADFRGFNMQANGTGIALERFTDFLISVRFEAPGETFAKGRQATVAIIDAKSGRAIETRIISDVFIGRSGRTTRPVWVRDRMCSPLEIRVTGGGRTITKKLDLNCGE